MTEYYVGVYNKTGTSEPLWVPVPIVAHMSATLSLDFHGETGGMLPSYYRPIQKSATARIFIEREDIRGAPYEFSHEADVRLELERPTTGEDPTTEAESRIAIFDIRVWVGSYEGSFTKFRVVQIASVQLGTGTYDGLDDMVNSCEMFAFAHADPEIYIDPSWEHADKFGLVFPENVTMTPLPLPRLVTPIREPDGNVVIHWIGDGVLQESLTVSDPTSWVDSSNQDTPQSITPDALSRFYRVIASP
jgi:hypothetical protein